MFLGFVPIYKQSNTIFNLCSWFKSQQFFCFRWNHRLFIQCMLEKFFSNIMLVLFSLLTAHIYYSCCVLLELSSSPAEALQVSCTASRLPLPVTDNLSSSTVKNIGSILTALSLFLTNIKGGLSCGPSARL